MTNIAASISQTGSERKAPPANVLPRGARRGDEYRTRPVGLWNQPLQAVDLRQIVDRDVRIRGKARQVILMVILGGVERTVRLDSGGDRFLEGMRLIELGDVGLRDRLLDGTVGEDRRPILWSRIGSLAIELRRVMGH